MLSDFIRMLTFVDSYLPQGFVKSSTSQKTPRIRFDAISVGVLLALDKKPNLKPKNIDWINGREFNDAITKGGQNAPTAIKHRIEFVFNKLLNEK